jgi:hypothetical protein
MEMNENIKEEDLSTVTFWLTNILRYLTTEQMRELVEKLTSRIGAQV